MLVQIGVTLGTPLLFLITPAFTDFFAYLVTSLYLVTILVIDIENRLILHISTIAGAALGFLVGSYFHGVLKSLSGGIAGFLFIFLLYLLLNASIKAMREADEPPFGFGDVTISGVLGLFVGWPTITNAILTGTLIGGFFGLCIFIYQKIRPKTQPVTHIPYGPFLIAGAVIAFISNL